MRFTCHSIRARQVRTPVLRSEDAVSSLYDVSAIAASATEDVSSIAASATEDPSALGGETSLKLRRFAARFERPTSNEERIPNFDVRC